MLVTLQQI